MRNKILLTLALLALAACSGGKQNPKSVIDLASIESSSATPEGKAEAVALAAEGIAYGPGFMHAADLFDIALGFDPNNVRARLYKAALAPAMDAHGILRRIQPVVRQLDVQNQLSFQTEVDKIPAGGFKDFLYDGKEDITNEKEIQAFVHVIQDDLRNLRKTLGELSSQTLVLNANIPVSIAQPLTIARDCQVEEVSKDVYWVYQCDIYKKQVFNVNYADWEAMRMAVAGFQVYYTLWNAYDMSGLGNVLKKLENYNNPSDRQVITLVQQEANLGKLVDVQSLKEVLDMGAEGVQALKYATGLQQSLCPSGYDTPNSRPGSIFSRGLCVTSEAVRAIPTVEAGLRGPVSIALDVFRSYRHVETWNGYTYDWYDRAKVGNYYTTVDATKVLNGSASDLKNLLPTQFDACGNATNLPDGTLAGAFVSGDAATAIQTGREDFLKETCQK